MSFKAQKNDSQILSSGLSAGAAKHELTGECGSRRQVGISLDGLFPEAKLTGQAGTHVKGCTSDWRHVKPGDVFVALDNGEQDGHEDAREAVARGAIAVVCERLVPVFKVPVYEVEDSRVAYSEVCQALVGNPSHHLKVIGVSGGVGKSTTIALLESIFHAAGKDVGVMSGFKTYDGMARGPAMSATPTPASLATKLANTDAAGCSHLLLEVSAEMIAENSLAGIDFDTICLTNLADAANGPFHTAQDRRDGQGRLLNLLSQDGVAIVNGDDQTCCQLLAETSGPSFLFGLGDQSQIGAEVLHQNACEQVFLLTAGRQSAAVRTSILGDHHIQNCLAAATVAMAHGVELEYIARGIELLTSLPGRMQRVDCGQDFPVFVDAASTPDALLATLRTARKLATGKVICVLGDRASANTNENLIIQNIVCKLADVAIVTEELALVSESWPQRKDEETDTQIAQDRQEAIQWAVSAAELGDVVVIAGSSLGPALAFGGEKTTDVDIARDLLYARGESVLRLVG
ncbi:Mur ligase family protein [Adhaeretor mobilis]|uniref:MurE-like ligase n=1 Tax=Adhaeretor mobilis TaxID=1930276 RepID=A0A517MUR2_9BACT|nr:Mur ligase family protein [Adhaeretor mobilis]QDS98618.1 MurE-like ligase [Adhaeretor mobilis]